MKRIYLSSIVCLVLLMMTHCKEAVTNDPLEFVDFDQVPFEKLSDYGFFSGPLQDLTPNKRLLYYEPASSLFTDYAFKSRFIWMPDGKSAKLVQGDKEGRMDFPDETILIKNFFYPADFRAPEGRKRIIETRLMVKIQGKWEAFPYVWDEDQKEAHYKIIGGESEVKWMDMQGEEQVIEYIIPNKNQCKSCHNQDGQMVPIGVKAKHLNYVLDYGNRQNNQLIEWTTHGYLTPLEDIGQLSAMVDYQDQGQALHDRAMAYLDINCAHCHSAKGPASTSGLFLNYEEEDWSKIGVYKTPVAAGFGAGSFKFAIHPGKAEQSILTFRMASTEVGAAMPEIGRVIPHQEGLELIKDWINQLPEVEKASELNAMRKP